MSTASEPPPRPRKAKVYPGWLGGVAASGAACCTHPLDVSRVRMQTGPSRSMFHTIVDAVQAEGLRKGAYVGLSASILRQMSYSLTRFSVYDTLKNRMAAKRNVSPNELGMLQMGWAASLAGGIGGVVGNPADIVLVRMVSDVNHPPASRKGYRNCFDGLLRMVREEGVGSLFRGLGPNVARAVLMNASQLATYDTFKISLLRTKLFKEGLWLHFCASSMAGVVATTICSPFDVLKSRIMNGSKGGATIMSIVRDSFQKEGAGWLFRGWTPAFIRLGPNTVLIFIGLEQLKLLWDRVAPE